MSVDMHDYTQRDPRCTCRPIHGNADDDGICKFCRPRIEAAQEARAKAVEGALGRFMAAIEALPGERQEHALERLATSMATSQGDAPESCLLCGWTDGCKPDCAALAIAGLL